LSTLEYDDSIWHHVVAVRDRNDDKCTLYITNLDGTNPESAITVNNIYGSDNVDADGHWVVGSIKNVDGNWFKGWIDDIIHWNEYLLTATEADELSKTNFGTEAHRLDVNLDITDGSGNFVSNVYSGPLTKISFQDHKDQSETTDSAYLVYNITMNLPETTVTAGQRLNFSMNYISPTSPWEDLELDMKIDDTGFTPFPSYIQIPFPDNPFPSYITYILTTELEVFVNNVGDDGIYFIYQGTRVNFNGTNGAYASFIHRINGTTNDWQVHEDRDSIYIPAGESAELFFYSRPTDHPCQNSGNNCPQANVIPTGDYRVALWVNGYSDQGESFGRSVILGQVNVI